MFKIENDLITIEETIGRINTGAIEYYDLEFEFNSSWQGLTKIAVLVNKTTEVAVAVPIMGNIATVPFLTDSSTYSIGVMGYTIEEETKTLQISTNLVSFWVDKGAGSIETEEQTVPTPTIWEQYVSTMNGILDDTIEIKEATNVIKTETQQIKTDVIGLKNQTEELKEETKGYRNETEGFKNITQQTIAEGFEMLGGLADSFIDTTVEKTKDFNENAIEKTEAFDLNTVNKTTAFDNNATEKTNIVNEIKDDVEDLRDETLGYKNDAKGSADKAKVSEDNAKDSEEDAELALSDLLAMLGTSVATLTGGKLTPSQIPDLSINDVFPVADTDEMLELTAQRGDVAIIVVENVVTDTYMLSADDPTVLSNWKKLGVSYVANAGHATTADNATDSEKINGKRIVGMTESQYASAVLDENTYYMVYPD